MATLAELRAAHEVTGAALREAVDRLTVIRQEARDSIRVLADLETSNVTEDVDPEQLRAARDRRTAALAALAAIRLELRPNQSASEPKP